MLLFLTILFIQKSQQAGLSLRELARQIGENHSNIGFWERSGKPPRSDLLLPIANALGVSVADVLGISHSKRNTSPPGKLGQVFEAASRLPRRQQQKIIEFVEPFVRDKAPVHTH